jgi:hypothetical protein
VVKGRDPDAQGRFLEEYRRYFDSVRVGRWGREGFSVIEFRTDNLEPAELAAAVTETLT